MDSSRPNVLFIMCDQLRADAIGALGNPDVYTPNFDRLAKRGVVFTNAYSSCPVCIAARYTIRTGCEPATTGIYGNLLPDLVEGQPADIEERCGPYLGRVMSEMGYRTFKIGKSHTMPAFEDLGYEVHLRSEEIYGNRTEREDDSYVSFITEDHPEYGWVEMLMGERTEMYYMPQMSPFPAEIGVEAWAADRAVEAIDYYEGRPYFGFVSFIGPHPPFAPPQPFNRMYNPDRMPNPILGDIEIDHMDEQIPWMNYIIWAEDINDPWARVLKARYYGEISYIDRCLGRILDTVESRPDADNTLICLFSDHGDHMGDHHAWQKESFFEASCRVPFLLSWPAELPANARREELVGLADLFGIATNAAGRRETRDGADVLGILNGTAPPRDRIFAFHERPGSPFFKIMVRDREWKYIFMANGGREQLFNMIDDPSELRQRLHDAPETAAGLRAAVVERLSIRNAERALEKGDLKSFPYTPRNRARVIQMDAANGVGGFPEHPGDVQGSLDW